jgi:hypothetical protein
MHVIELCHVDDLQAGSGSDGRCLRAAASVFWRNFLGACTQHLIICTRPVPVCRHLPLRTIMDGIICLLLCTPM